MSESPRRDQSARILESPALDRHRHLGYVENSRCIEAQTSPVFFLCRSVCLFSSVAPFLAEITTLSPVNQDHTSFLTEQPLPSSTEDFYALVFEVPVLHRDSSSRDFLYFMPPASDVRSFSFWPFLDFICLCVPIRATGAFAF